MYSTGTRIAMGIVVAYAAVSLFAPIIAPYPETELVGSGFMPPSAAHWFGTDQLGRDMLTRVLYGGRITIALSLLITGLALLIGASLGFAAALMGSWFDMIMSRMVDAVMTLPSLIVSLLVLCVLGSSIPALVGVVAILEAVRIFRLARAIGMDTAAMDFVEVARLRGESVLWIMRRQILPNAVGLLTVEFALRFNLVILFVSSLSFMGLGLQPPNADWGSMVRENAMAINFGLLSPLFPAAAIAGLTVAVNTVVDGIASGRRKALLQRV